MFTANSAYGVATQSSITLTISDHELTANVLPGTLGISESTLITVATDNYTGYTLSAEADSVNKLVSTNNDEIPSLTGSAISQSTYASNNAYNNTFGFRPSQYVTTSGNTNTVVSNNTDFLPVPDSTGMILDITNVPVPASSANQYTIEYGIKPGPTQALGTYTYEYIISAVGHESIYNITYNNNAGQDTVNSMPSPNPQAISVDAGTPAVDSYGVLSVAAPTRAGYTFAGWCDEATTPDQYYPNNQYCGGTTYQPGDHYGIDQTSSATNITLYAIWLEDPFPMVWSQMGKCVFTSTQIGSDPATYDGDVSGSQCSEYAGDDYIDTGIPLYSNDNYQKDYEVHFTLDTFSPSAQLEDQATMFNDKLSSSVTASPYGGKSPGIIVRLTSSNTFEVKSTYGAPTDHAESKVVTKTPHSTAYNGTDVRIFRIDGVIYTSIDNGPLVELQDYTSFNQQFGLTAWFGAYPDNVNCTEGCTAAKRFFTGEMSNMYIKLGDMPSDRLHTITFDADGGTPATTTYLIVHDDALGELPAVTKSGWLFDGWYTAPGSSGTEVTSTTKPSTTATYYAHWYKSVNDAQITNTSVALSVSDTETITITNASDIEPYTLVSSDTNVATVDSSGVITAVANGLATITMTGTKTGDTRTITVTVGNTISVDFDSQGGTPATYQESVAIGGSFSSLPEPTRGGYTFEGWYTGTGGTGTELTTSTVFGANTPTQYYANWVESPYVCKIAKAGTLHVEKCNSSGSGDGCRRAGYSLNDDITYGTIVSSSTPVAGNAYNCDVNNDGFYDNVTERFYYFGTENGNAKFVYYKNLVDDKKTYSEALTYLPDSTTWSNPHLATFSDTPYTTYTGKVARFMTYSEAHAICDNSDANLGTDGKCLYLLEKSAFANPSIDATPDGLFTDGIWLEQSGTQSSRIHTRSRSLGHNTTYNAPRATIEVPTDYVEPYSALTFNIAFDPHNETSSWIETINNGDTLANIYPANDPTYSHHLFQGWFTEESGGTLVTSSTQPSNDATYHAQWLKDVTLAVFGSNSITVETEDTETVVITNSSELESYSFSSLDSTIATVDASGVVTGVAEGTTSIRITGALSGLTNSIEVNVRPDSTPNYTVTFNPNGGSFSDPNDSSKTVKDGSAVGALPTPTKANNMFFGWYKDDGTFYEEVYPEETISADVTYYAKWVENVTDFPIVFAETNECTFTGTNVTGNYCGHPNSNSYYIDTNVQLFTSANYNKEFEIGFTITEYTPASQITTSGNNGGSQATFVSSKKEDNANNYPGFVIRRYSGSNFIEITSRWKGDAASKTKKDIPYATTKNVKIARRKETEQGSDYYRIYYSINNGAWTLYEDITNKTHFEFNTKVWFGGAEAANGTSPMRPLVGKMTDMYIKLSANTDYVMTFDANGGQASESTRSVAIGDQIGTLPTMITNKSGNYTFDGWYNENNQLIDATYQPSGDEMITARWSYNSSKTPVEFDMASTALSGYQTIVNSYQPQIATFNEADPIEDSTWGVAKATYLSALENNFASNECMFVPAEDSELDWGTTHTVNCSKPKSFDTGISTGVTVYEYDVANDTIAQQPISYVKSENGVIHNLIPGKDYYWEDSSDGSVYGVISAKSTANNRRQLDISDVWNVRDLGGLPVDTDGDGTVDGTIEYGKLIRGGRLNTNSSTTTELQNLGVDKEYDVAKPGELSTATTGDKRMSNYVNDEVVHYNFDYGTTVFEDSTNKDSYAYARKAVTDIMNDVISGNNIYFHCRVGADRTGTVAYILEGLLGVPDEQRYQDYEMTSVSGLNDRTRYYAVKGTGNNRNPRKFLFMMGFLKTNADILNWYLKDTTDAGAQARIAAFKNAMITSSSSHSPLPAPNQ